MIERIVIQGYRCFVDMTFEPNPGMNIIVGDNEAGKSTLLEAINLALTGKINGRWAREELNPFWFNQNQVAEYFVRYGSDDPAPAPTILVELYLSSDGDDGDVHRLRGVNNSLHEDKPGLGIYITPDDEYAEELAIYMSASPPMVMPVEFYKVEWCDFSLRALSGRPKALSSAFIDSRTIRSTSGVDYHMREILSEHLDTRERALISLAHRKAKQEITEGPFADINARISEANAELHDRPIGLQMDQSARTSWEVGVVPQVDEIPFGMSGQGQQAAIKVSLAMSRTAGRSAFVLIEEPENHLSHTSLTKLVGRIEQLAGEEQQLFVTTHSSFVLNRLGLDKLILLRGDAVVRLASLPGETVAYFRKLAGYDTLRLTLSRKLALVEGPSDGIVLERAYRDLVGHMPSEDGIDIVSMGGLTFKRALEVCAALNRDAVALQDNDGNQIDDVVARVEELLYPDRRTMFVGEPGLGKTLEPQLRSVNTDEALKQVLGVRASVDLSTWMPNHKTEGALRILDSADSIMFPAYIVQAVEQLR